MTWKCRESATSSFQLWIDHQRLPEMLLGSLIVASVTQDGSYVVVSCCCTHGLLKMRQRALNVTRFGERFCKVIATGLVRRLSHECLLQQRQRLCDPSL